MDISYNSKLFSLKHSSEYTLSIQANLNGFSFCIYHQTKDAFLLLKHFSIKVNENLEYFLKRVTEITEKEEIFSHNFHQVNFIYFTPNSLILPEELSKEQDLKSYLEFQHEVGEFDELHRDKIEKLNLSFAYTIPSGLTNIFLNKFKNVNYLNQYSVLVKLGYDILDKESLTSLCLIHKSESFFDIILFKDKKLELCNSFKYKTENDLVYYSVSTLKNLDLIDDIPVCYSGNFHAIGQDTLMLDKFIHEFQKNEPKQINKANNTVLFKKHQIYNFAPLYFVNY